MALREPRQPTLDQSHCDLEQHEYCTGYTEDGQESCFCTDCDHG